MKFLITLVCLIVLSLNADSGLAFLKYERNPMISSTATVGALFNKTSQSANYNPAFVSGLEGTEIGLSYSSYIEDGYFSTFDIRNDLGFGSVVLNIDYFDAGDFEGRYKPSEDQQFSFGASNLMMNLGYGYALNDFFAIGVSGKAIYESIEFVDAWGYSFNFGVNSENLIDGLLLSVYASDLGSMDKLEEKATDLPFSINFGAGYNFTLSDFGVKLGAENRYDFEDEDNYTKIGSEVSWQNMIFLRGGYRINNEGMPFSVGAGFNFYDVKVDYSFTQFDDFGDVHGIGVSYLIM
ncbi:MAG: hypothetical protein JXR48_02830 [Candidatus Delongbacteria bacterium]|nr:hypothetical protein [Candidatus Delongbacteria bacterium]MBN2833882.1 hypothetical protein [Candidatus Delongbacteria bacterium]